MEIFPTLKAELPGEALTHFSSRSQCSSRLRALCACHFLFLSQCYILLCLGVLWPAHQEPMRQMMWAIPGDIWCKWYRKSFIKKPSSCSTHPKEFGQGTQNTKEHTHTHTEAEELREQRSSLFRAEVKGTHLKEASVGVLAAGLLIPLLVLFLALWMGEGLFD